MITIQDDLCNKTFFEIFRDDVINQCSLIDTLSCPRFVLHDTNPYGINSVSSFRFSFF